MEQILLIALAIMAAAAVLYAVWGCIEAGSGWRSWLVEAMLPFYGMIAVGLVCLLAVAAIAVWSWRTLFNS